MVYNANWVIIYLLPPIKGTRNNHWNKKAGQFFRNVAIRFAHNNPRPAVLLWCSLRCYLRRFCSDTWGAGWTYHFPWASMGLVYLPTFWLKPYGKSIGKYTIHGSLCGWWFAFWMKETFAKPCMFDLMWIANSYVWFRSRWRKINVGLHRHQFENDIAHFINTTCKNKSVFILLHFKGSQYLWNPLDIRFFRMTTASNKAASLP